MGPRCSSAETQVCHRSYIIAASGSWAKEKLSTRGRKRTLTDSEIKRNRSEVSSKWNKCRIYVGDQLDRCRWMERTQGSA